MISTWPRAFNHLLSVEGGYVDHPNDPGGCTKYGISLRFYRSIKPAATCKDIKELTPQQAEQIYKTYFWDVIRGDELPVGIDLCVFDAAVNSGDGRAISWLYSVLSMSAKSRVTDELLHRLRSADPVQVVRDYSAKRLAYLRGLKTWPVFGRGWSRRVSSTQALALQLIEGGVT